MDINNEVNKNKIISEDDSKTKNLIEKRIKKYKSKLPESYWSETSWAIRTKPMKKRLKTNPGIPLRLSKIVFEKDDLFMSEDDSENEWSSQDFIQAVNAAEADDDDSEEDDWDNDINELNEVEAEKVKKESTEKAAESAKADDDEEKNKSLLVL